MASYVNTAVYGSESEWSDVFLSGQVKTAVFGDETDYLYNPSSIFNGQYKNKLTIGVPIDNSVSVGAVDNECEWAKVVTFKYNADSEIIKYVDKRDITPFLLFHKNGVQQDSYNYNFQFGASYRNKILGNFGGYEFNPETYYPGDNIPYTFGELNERYDYNPGYQWDDFNPDGKVAPITQFQYKNVVWLVVVGATSEPPTYFTVPEFFDLQKYITDAYISHPYVMGVFAIPFVYGLNGDDNMVNTQFIGVSLNTVLNIIKPNGEGNEPTLFYALNGAKQNIVGVYNSGQQYASYEGVCVGGSSGFYTDYINTTADADARSKTCYTFGEQFDIIKYEGQVYPLYKSKDGEEGFGNYVVDATTISAFEEYCLKQVAYFGMWFCTDTQTLINLYINQNYNSQYMYLGLVGTDGINHGEYTYGTDNTTQEQYNWENPFEDNKKYNPDNPGGEKSDKMELNTPGISSLSTFNKAYVLNKDGANGFANWLWYAGGANWLDTLLHYSLNNNPIDCIVSLKAFPFNVLNVLGLTYSTNYIHLGNTDTSEGLEGVDTKFAVPIENLDTTQVILNLGEIDINLPDVFTSYPPYKSACLYIPYCNTIDIPLKEFNKSKLSVKMIVDLLTGACCAEVFKDTTLYATVNGVCASDINITGRNNNEYSRQMINNASTTVSGGLGLAMGASLATTATTPAGAIGASGAIIGGLINSANAVHDLVYTQPQVINSGSANGVIGLSQPQYCYLIYKTYTPINEENYSHNVGHACNVSKKLSDFSGFTQFSKVDLTNIKATEKEIDEIRSGLSMGIYL